MQTKKVKPYGMLYSQGREYFLLSPHPIISDDWEWDVYHRAAYRFAVVPRKKVWVEPFRYIYSYARHIVSTSYVAEYVPDMPEIEILQYDPDLSEYELDLVTNKE